MNWTLAPLREVAKVISGFAFKSADFQQDDGVPVIKISNIRNGDINLTDVDRVPIEFLGLDSKYHVSSGDILISLTGSHITLPNSVVGRVAKYRYESTALLNQRAGKIIPMPDTIDKEFLYQYLTLDNVRREIALMGHGGANQCNISPSNVEGIHIPIPPLPTQQKIASILSAYDDLIENNLKRIKLLEEAAQNIYREWFVNFRVNGEQLEPEKETMLPRAWRIGAFGTIAQFLGGYAFKSNAYSQQGRFKVVTIKNVGDRNFDDSRFDLIPEIPKEMKAHCKINEGDILLSLTGNVGRTCLAFGDNLLLNQRVAIVREQQSSFREYVYYLLGSDEMRAQMTNLSNGVAQQNLSPIKLAAHPVVIPENTTVENFSRIAQPMLKQMVTLRIANAKLKEARDLLLPRLMEGSLEV